ncbi:MAG: PQQ-binding-like beta-propeller repeat protein [Planctomycetaceae bacterium]
MHPRSPGNTLALMLALLLSLNHLPAVRGQVPGNWPQWRGLNRDGVSTETGMAKRWPPSGPAVSWQVDTVGVGYSSIAVHNGRIFTQGDLKGVEHIIALSEHDGRVLWAVQPGPVKQHLAQRVGEEMQRVDRNGDGAIDEIEALTRFGWDFNKFDQPAAPGADAGAVAQVRAKRLFAVLDKNSDKHLSYEEVGNLLRDYFARIDTRDAQADHEQFAKSRSQSLLKLLDKDGDGSVSREESRRSALERPFRRADQRDPQTDQSDQRLTADEIETYLAKSEAGKDGQITTSELSDYYQKHAPGRPGKLTSAGLRGYYGGYRNGQGDGPRGTPTVDDDRLYVEGGNGDLSCLDVVTGKTIWHVNLSSQLSGGRPGWGFCESPLVEGEMLIVTPGGKQGTIAALNKFTGEQIWRSGSVTEGAHYSSPVATNIGGVRQIVQFARGSCFGITIDDGSLLWQYSGANNGTANCATPIIYNDHVFASSAYGKGGGLAKISSQNGKQQADEVYFEKRMANHHGGIVRLGDHMYGFGSGGLICMEYMTGKIVWRARSVGKGSLVVADDMLYLLSERYEMALAEATPQEYRETGRFKIKSHGRPSWAHPVVTGGRLYIRNQQSLTSYDISRP